MRTTQKHLTVIVQASDSHNVYVQMMTGLSLVARKATRGTGLKERLSGFYYRGVPLYEVTATRSLTFCRCRSPGSQQFTRRGTRKLLPPRRPKSNQGDRAQKTAEVILRYLKPGMLWYLSHFVDFNVNLYLRKKIYKTENTCAT